MAVFGYGSDTASARLMAFEGSYRGGVDVAAGDLNGDGMAELAVAAGAGGSRVRVLEVQTGDELVSVFVVLLR